METYTVNFICKHKDGEKVVRSEEILLLGIDDVIEKIKLKWASWDIEIIWAGIRLNDDV
ncbi:MAG: hypothetical protein ACXV7E_03290 [Methylobacter sp.]